VSAPGPHHRHQPTCKPGFVWPTADAADVTAIRLGRRLPGASGNLPERLVRTDPGTKANLCPAPLLFGLAPGGVYRAVSVAGNAVRSYRTVSPLPASLPRKRDEKLAVCFSVALSLGSPPPDVIRHRSSVEPGLSSPPPFRDYGGAAVQSTDSDGMGTKRPAVKSAVRPGRLPPGRHGRRGRSARLRLVSAR
jgi:hypothetical protein